MGQELHDAKEIFWPSLAVSILTALAAFGGMLLLIVPGIIFAFWFAFSMYATVLDHMSPIEAMKYSKSLIDGRWWSVAMRLFIPSLLFALLFILIQRIVEIPLTFILDNTDPTSLLYVSWDVLAQLATTFVSALFTPLTSAIPTILYIALKNPRVEVAVEKE